MAIVKVMQGDLLRLFKTGAFQAIAHGCNTQNLMGAGIADQIREQFPEAYVADTDFHQRMNDGTHSKHSPIIRMGGELSVAHVKQGQIFNLYTQLEPGRNGDYQLLQKAMENLNKFCKQRSIQRVGVPLIAAGIAGLDIIGAMTVMNACTPDIDLTVVVWDKDQVSWLKASQFRNYSFPRKFEGVAVVKNLDKRLLSILTFETDGKWHDATFTTETQSIRFNGETALSLSNSSPYKFLVIGSVDELDEVKDRLYTK